MVKVADAGSLGALTSSPTQERAITWELSLLARKAQTEKYKEAWEGTSGGSPMIRQLSYQPQEKRLDPYSSQYVGAWAPS